MVAPLAHGTVRRPARPTGWPLAPRRAAREPAAAAPKPGQDQPAARLSRERDVSFLDLGEASARNARSRGEDLLGYNHFAGHPQLREAIAEYLGVARGVDCRPEQVIVVTGAQAALDLSRASLMDDGDVAWMEEPGYIGARSAFLAGGARLAPLRVSREGWGSAIPACRRRG